jgi:hypothetical protein
VIKILKFSHCQSYQSKATGNGCQYYF